MWHNYTKIYFSIKNLTRLPLFSILYLLLEVTVNVHEPPNIRDTCTGCFLQHYL